MLKIYPDPRCTLNYEKPYQLLIATILASQSTDEGVNKITKNLFKKYDSLEKFANANIYELENDIRSVGFYKNKAKNIIQTAKILLEEYDGVVPDKMDELIKLKGVGRKTANVILANIYNIPSIIVDTHCLRLSTRLGFTKSKDPVKVEMELREIVPEKFYTLYSNLMVYHGRNICKAIKPKCQICTVCHFCDYFINTIMKTKG